MDVKGRLKLFIKYLGLTNQQFELNVGVSNGYIANMREGVGKMGLERISNKYPELNIGWLLTGEGEMIKTTSPISHKNMAAEPWCGYEKLYNIPEVTNKTDIKKEDNIETIIDLLAKQLQEKDDQIKTLLDLIKTITSK